MITEGFQVTTAIKKLSKLKARTRVVPGGTSAGKTFGILPLLIETATVTNGVSISVVSETIPHLKKGAIKDFQKIMKSTNRWHDERYNKTDRVYTFANGSYIEFFSADSEGRVRGPRRDILYLNEANNLLFDTYYQLAIRTAQTIWLDFNPSNEFWAHSELLDDEDAQWLTLTYKDNQALVPAIVKEIEKNRTKAFFDENLTSDELWAESNIKSSYWANWWKVYGLGQLGSLEGVIFSNWSMIGSIPPTAKLLGYGQDFGFTNDPAATVAVYSYDGKIVVHELIYKRGLINAELVREYKRVGVNPSFPIWADGAEPKTIKEISGYGYLIEGATKGADSIIFGLDLLQGYEILVTSESTNIIDEFRTYAWQKDRKTGNNTNIPIGIKDHAIAALRYLAVMMLTNYQPNYKGKGHGRIKHPSKKEFYKDFI
jgi:phage terminase large subunit